MIKRIRRWWRGPEPAPYEQTVFGRAEAYARERDALLTDLAERVTALEQRLGPS